MRLAYPRIIPHVLGMLPTQVQGLQTKRKGLSALGPSNSKFDRWYRWFPAWQITFFFSAMIALVGFFSGVDPDKSDSVWVAGHSVLDVFGYPQIIEIWCFLNWDSHGWISTGFFPRTLQLNSWQPYIKFWVIDIPNSVTPISASSWVFVYDICSPGPSKNWKRREEECSCEDAELQHVVILTRCCMITEDYTPWWIRMSAIYIYIDIYIYMVCHLPSIFAPVLLASIYQSTSTMDPIWVLYDSIYRNSFEMPCGYWEPIPISGPGHTYGPYRMSRYILFISSEHV